MLALFQDIDDDYYDPEGMYFSIQEQTRTNQSLIELPSEIYSFFNLLWYKTLQPQQSKKSLTSTSSKKNTQYGLTVSYNSNNLDCTKQIYLPSLSSYFRLTNNIYLFTSSNSFMLFNPIQNKIIGIFPILEHNYFRRPEIFKEEGDAFLIETYYYRKKDTNYLIYQKQKSFTFWEHFITSKLFMEQIK